MPGASNTSNNSNQSMPSLSLSPHQPPTEAPAATTMAREYEFFVTTEKPHLPNGAERGMIRRLVMRNFFETKTTARQAGKSEHSSATTVMARQQLNNRFRLPKSGNENDSKRESKKVKNKSKAKKSRTPKTTSKTTEGSLGDEARHSMSVETSDKSEGEVGSVVVKKFKLRLDPSAHRIDPFDILPVPGTPQFDMLFRLCAYPFKNTVPR